MLKLLPKAPDDLGKKGEISKLSGVLDRATKDEADLRFYSSNDGRRTYLRVWETGSEAPGKGDGARWYECIAAPVAPTEEAATKKK